MKCHDVMIVDDELLARQRLAALLRLERDMRITGEYRNGAEAIAAIRAAPPDILFLDVQMPEIDGFGVLEALRGSGWPLTIFVTAYDHYAIRAFEFHALDYLLKPFNRDRFAASLNRARHALVAAKPKLLGKKLHDLLHAVQDHRAYPSRIVVWENGQYTFVALRDVSWIRAAGNYLACKTPSQTYLLRQSMRDMAASVDPDQFIRIHRSVMVNLAQVKFLRRLAGGRFQLHLSDGQVFSSGRGYRANLERLLKQAGAGGAGYS